MLVYATIAVTFGEKRWGVVIGRIYKNITYIGHNMTNENSFSVETKIVKKP